MLKIFSPDIVSSFRVPLFDSFIKAGFPSPASDLVERKLDLNELLIQHPNSTFFVRVEGDSMIDANIYSGDILIVDKSITPKDGSIIVAILDGEFTVKRFRRKGHSNIYLCPENKKFKPVKITKDMDFEVWGVVTNIIHRT